MFQMFDKFISNSTAKHIITSHNNVLLLNCGHECILVRKLKIKTKKKLVVLLTSPSLSQRPSSKSQIQESKREWGVWTLGCHSLKSYRPASYHLNPPHNF